jgi:hypothetical protein
VILEVARMEHPSVRHWTTLALSVGFSLFILNIMLDRASIVKQNVQLGETERQMCKMYVCTIVNRQQLVSYSSHDENVRSANEGEVCEWI